MLRDSVMSRRPLICCPSWNPSWTPTRLPPTRYEGRVHTRLGNLYTDDEEITLVTQVSPSECRVCRVERDDPLPVSCLRDPNFDLARWWHHQCTSWAEYADHLPRPSTKVGPALVRGVARVLNEHVPVPESELEDIRTMDRFCCFQRDGYVEIHDQTFMPRT